MNIILMGTCITIFGALMGGLIAAIGSFLQNKSSSERNNRIESGVNKSVEIGQNTNSDVVSLAKQLSKVYKDLDTANKTIAGLERQLKNEITGGDSKPILKVFHSPLLTESVTKRKYFVIYFDIFNPNSYALQNVHATVSDFWGPLMIQHLGEVHLRDGKTFGVRPPTPQEIADHKLVHHFENIGSIAKNTSFPLYITSFCPELAPELSNDPNAHYVIEIKWYNGSFVYYLTLGSQQDKLINIKTQLVYNGEIIDNKKYIEFQ